MILNLGSGKDPRGDIRMDIYPLPNVNKVWDLEKGIPYPDNTFDEIICDCIFEHMRNPNALIQECYRVLKKGGKLDLLTDNAGYLLFHIMKRAIHGNYCDGTGGDEGKDRHYALYTVEHLKNHFLNAGFEKDNINIKHEKIMQVTGWKKFKREGIQELIKFIFNERVGYARLHCIVKK